MKKILCFGDSNTFGYNPKDASRYKETERWSGILKEKLLRKNFEVIEAGCNNRKCFVQEPAELCGAKLLPEYLQQKLDFIILALGINDVQKFYMPDNSMIKSGILNLINISKKLQKDAKILILAPSILNNNVTTHHYFSNLFNEWSVEKSKEIPKIYTQAAHEAHCDIIDLNEIARVCAVDGLHYEISEHEKIAQKLYEYFLNFI